MLHDTHVHLEMLLERLGYLDENTRELDLDQSLCPDQSSSVFLNKALEKHLFAIQSTVSTRNFHFVNELFAKIPKIKFLLGTHPENVTEDFDIQYYLQEQKSFLEQNFVNLNLIGIGEIGLDYHYTKDKNLHKIQNELFETQIQLAIDYNLPIEIHCREAFEDTFAMLEKYPQIHGKFDIHCFTGGVEEAKKALEMGGKLGIGGIVSFNNAQNLQAAVKYVPIESLLLETDLPFLAPIPFRGKICLPEYIDNVAGCVAALKNFSKDEIWTSCEQNARGLFRLD